MDQDEIQVMLKARVNILLLMRNLTNVLSPVTSNSENQHYASDFIILVSIHFMGYIQMCSCVYAMKKHTTIPN